MRVLLLLLVPLLHSFQRLLPLLLLVLHPLLLLLLSLRAVLQLRPLLLLLLQLAPQQRILCRCAPCHQPDVPAVPPLPQRYAHQLAGRMCGGETGGQSAAAAPQAAAARRPAPALQTQRQHERPEPQAVLHACTNDAHVLSRLLQNIVRRMRTCRTLSLSLTCVQLHLLGLQLPLLLGCARAHHSDLDG